MIPVEHLTARRGATFGPRGWPLLDANGTPLRDPAGIRVQAQVRPRPGSRDVVYSWDSGGETPNARVDTLVLPEFDGQVVVVLLEATADETDAWTWRRLPYDVLVTAFDRTDEVVHGDFVVEQGVTTR